MYKNPKFSKYSILQILQRFPGKISLIRFKLKRSSAYLARAFNLNSMNYSQTTDTYHFLEINTLTQIHTTIRGCLHDTWNKISFRHEKKFCLYKFSLRAKWNEANFCFDLLIDYLCFYEIFACAVVSFWMISFKGSVYITFITRNEISFLSKWPQWNNMYLIQTVIRDWPDTKWKNLISPKMESHENTRW